MVAYDAPRTARDNLRPGGWSLLFPHAPIARRQRVSIRSTDAKRSNTTHERNQAPSSSIPRSTFFILWREEDVPYAMALALAAKGLLGQAWRRVHSKQEWPNWHPTNDYLQRQPAARSSLNTLQSGSGMVAGLANPLGARALYLWQGNKDTLYRIHGTNEPWTIGQNVSSGCIRLTNEDVIDLYDRTSVGAKVVVL